ncbi:rRNA maturation RNase YbeY [Trichocoleus sp. ST-U2]|uniref:rRNA maturation RNase YbeY n=1 Tax=Coleofasciculus sp. FACHB-SPT9 TaxID=2692791 RepID=UPI0018F00521|nr:rRNA maturation RNase YbeY [Coleofasciculus sp. FACHB-SPT9]
MGINIEVSIQDYFFSSNPADASAQEEISPETWETWFHRWMETLHLDIPQADAYELSLRLTDDKEIQTLNAQYRHQNKPTDVLAFASLEVDCPQPMDFLEDTPLYLGDIAISVETATRQALQQEHPLKTELAWLAAHGLLHLLGWDHPDEDSLTKMLNQQETLLQVIGLTI